MLSRKGPCAGADRGRVGERLQAAVAGLQELHLLRDRQGDMVSWALKLDREAPVTCGLAGPEDPWMLGAEEQRLEATLASLKQQLSRLRKQDVGLKTHLQQLDQQISELKLDVSKASTEQPEPDSRPSSGFYELSDGGSCSLSNSCTSVYSECLSSSQTSLLLRPMSPARSHVSPSSQVDVCRRRRSADENAAQSNPPRATGLHLGSSRIRASTACSEQARQRPVSTGDLDMMMAQGPSYYNAVDPRKPSTCASLKTTAVDARFQSNLVSRSGTEVYHYPSPLHAVALQSPIFYSGGDLATPGLVEAQEQTVGENKTLSYIDRLIRRGLTKGQPGTEMLQTHSYYHRKPTEGAAGRPEVCRKEGSILQLLPAQTTNISPVSSDQKRCEDPESDPAERKGCRQISTLAHSRSHEVPPRHASSPEFVHARFVPAGSQRVKVRQADRKTKAVKLRRKNGDRPRATRQQHGYSSGEKTTEAGGAAKGEHRRSAKAKVAQTLATCRTDERRQGSGSDSSHCSPGLMCAHQVQPDPHPVPPAAKPGKSRRPEHVEYERPAEQRKRRQGSARWPCDAEMFQASCAQRQRLLEPHVQALGNVRSLRSMGAKPGRWVRQPRPLQSPVSSDSFLYSLHARYPPAPFPVSGLYPPRCESEYSAECASLFHSTIAESSEGEMSDNTTNRFGDSESSHSFQSLSDSDGSLSPEEEDRGLVWADAAVGPTAAGQTLRRVPRPGPSACRIKASRALKKKIRRFQPASLKVMTLV